MNTHKSTTIHEYLIMQLECYTVAIRIHYLVLFPTSSKILFQVYTNNQIYNILFAPISNCKIITAFMHLDVSSCLESLMTFIQISILSQVWFFKLLCFHRKNSEEWYILPSCPPKTLLWEPSQWIRSVEALLTLVSLRIRTSAVPFVKWLLEVLA